MSCVTLSCSYCKIHPSIIPYKFICLHLPVAIVPTPTFFDIEKSLRLRGFGKSHHQLFKHVQACVHAFFKHLVEDHNISESDALLLLAKKSRKPRAKSVKRPFAPSQPPATVTVVVTDPNPASRAVAGPGAVDSRVSDADGLASDASPGSFFKSSLPYPGVARHL